MKFTITHLAIAAAVALSPLSIAQESEREKKEQRSSKQDKPSAMDKAWAQMTAASDQAELKLAKAAQEKAQSEHVKQHAQKIIQDHTKTSDELKKIAKSADIDLKAELPAAKREMIEEITEKSGQEFEQAYMQHEIAAHRMAIAHFQNGAEFLENEELKSFAQQNLPALQQHLKDAQQHSGQTTGTQSGASQRGTASSPASTQPGQSASPGAGRSQPQQGQVGTPQQQQ